MHKEIKATEKDKRIAIPVREWQRPNDTIERVVKI